VLAKTVFILDNNVARPDGGFGTRYPWFALIGVNPIPSPTSTDALGVVDVGYQYDYNSNAPADVLNPVAAVNSLVAYLYRHLNQNDLDLPVNPDGSPSVTCGSANTCGVTDAGAVLACPDARCAEVPEGDRVAAYVTQRGKTTYVTYTSNGLPLTNLIRDVVPFGNVIADLTEPVLTALVNSAYPHGNPIPADPSKYQPATPFSSLPQLASTALDSATSVSHATPATSAISETSASESASKIATDEPTVKKERPKRHVVRNSKKAVPAATADDDLSSKSDPVAGVDKAGKDDPAGSDNSVDHEAEPKPGKHEKADKT
jgi:hypothetical protein